MEFKENAIIICEENLKANILKENYILNNKVLRD